MKSSEKLLEHIAKKYGGSKHVAGSVQSPEVAVGHDRYVLPAPGVVALLPERSDAKRGELRFSLTFPPACVTAAAGGEPSGAWWQADPLLATLGEPSTLVLITDLGGRRCCEALVAPDGDGGSHRASALARRVAGATGAVRPAHMVEATHEVVGWPDVAASDDDSGRSLAPSVDLAAARADVLDHASASGRLLVGLILAASAVPSKFTSSMSGEAASEAEARADWAFLDALRRSQLASPLALAWTTRVELVWGGHAVVRAAALGGSVPWCMDAGPDDDKRPVHWLFNPAPWRCLDLRFNGTRTSGDGSVPWQRPSLGEVDTSTALNSVAWVANPGDASSIVQHHRTTTPHITQPVDNTILSGDAAVTIYKGLGLVVNLAPAEPWRRVPNDEVVGAGNDAIVSALPPLFPIGWMGGSAPPLEQGSGAYGFFGSRDLPPLAHLTPRDKSAEGEDSAAPSPQPSLAIEENGSLELKADVASAPALAPNTEEVEYPTASISTQPRAKLDEPGPASSPDPRLRAIRSTVRLLEEPPGWAIEDDDGLASPPELVRQVADVRRKLRSEASGAADDARRLVAADLAILNAWRPAEAAWQEKWKTHPDAGGDAMSDNEAAQAAMEEMHIQVLKAARSAVADIRSHFVEEVQSRVVDRLDRIKALCKTLKSSKNKSLDPGLELRSKHLKTLVLYIIGLGTLDPKTDSAQELWDVRARGKESTVALLRAALRLADFSGGGWVGGCGGAAAWGAVGGAWALGDGPVPPDTPPGPYRGEFSWSPALDAALVEAAGKVSVSNGKELWDAVSEAMAAVLTSQTSSPSAEECARRHAFLDTAGDGWETRLDEAWHDAPWGDAPAGSVRCKIPEAERLRVERGMRAIFSEIIASGTQAKQAFKDSFTVRSKEEDARQKWLGERGRCDVPSSQSLAHTPGEPVATLPSNDRVTEDDKAALLVDDSDLQLAAQIFAQGEQPLATSEIRAQHVRPVPTTTEFDPAIAAIYQSIPGYHRPRTTDELAEANTRHCADGGMGLARAKEVFVEAEKKKKRIATEERRREESAAVAIRSRDWDVAAAETEKKRMEERAKADAEIERARLERQQRIETARRQAAEKAERVRVECERVERKRASEAVKREVEGQEAERLELEQTDQNQELARQVALSEQEDDGWLIPKEKLGMVTQHGERGDGFNSTAASHNYREYCESDRENSESDDDLWARPSPAATAPGPGPSRPAVAEIEPYDFDVETLRLLSRMPCPNFAKREGCLGRERNMPGGENWQVPVLPVLAPALAAARFCLLTDPFQIPPPPAATLLTATPIRLRSRPGGRVPTPQPPSSCCSIPTGPQPLCPRRSPSG